MITLNENTIKGKWLEIRGDVQKAWGKLNNDELDKTKGDFKSISGLIQQRYGQAQANCSEKLTEIFRAYEQKKDEIVEATKAAVKAVSGAGEIVATAPITEPKTDAKPAVKA